MSHTHSPDSGHGGYETSDAHLGAIVKFLFWLFLGTAVVLFAMYGLVQAYLLMPTPGSDVELHPLATERQIPNEPRLEAQRGEVRNIHGNLNSEADEPYFNRKMARQWNEQWKEELSTYEYVDQQAGVARVPIERAMEMKLKQGFPTAKSKN
jgi:hypothetical protein